MSGAYAIRALLAAHTPLTAVVPVTRIHYGFVPIPVGGAMVLPALLINEISGRQRNTLAMTEASMLQTDRVQVTCFAKTYKQLRELMEHVRRACPNTRSTLATIAVESVVPDGRGADLTDAESFTQSQDFIVTWRSTS